MSAPRIPAGWTREAADIVWEDWRRAVGGEEPDFIDILSDHVAEGRWPESGMDAAESLAGLGVLKWDRRNRPYFPHFASPEARLRAWAAVGAPVLAPAGGGKPSLAEWVAAAEGSALGAPVWLASGRCARGAGSPFGRCLVSPARPSMAVRELMSAAAGVLRHCRPRYTRDDGGSSDHAHRSLYIEGEHGRLHVRVGSSRVGWIETTEDYMRELASALAGVERDLAGPVDIDEPVGTTADEPVTPAGWTREAAIIVRADYDNRVECDRYPVIGVEEYVSYDAAADVLAHEGYDDPHEVAEVALAALRDLGFVHVAEDSALWVDHNARLRAWAAVGAPVLAPAEDGKPSLAEWVAAAEGSALGRPSWSAWKAFFSRPHRHRIDCELLDDGSALVTDWGDHFSQWAAMPFSTPAELRACLDRLAGGVS